MQTNRKINIISLVFIYIGVFSLLLSLFKKTEILPLLGLILFLIGIIFYSYNRFSIKDKYFKFRYLYSYEIFSFLFGIIPFTIFILNLLGFNFYSALYFYIFFSCILISIILLFKKKTIIDYYKERAVFFNPIKNSSFYSVLIAIIIFTFYIELYWYPEKLKNVVNLFDTLSYLLRNKKSDQWFLYGSIYTICVIFWGIKFIKKHKGKVYHKWRTLSLILSQLIFSYFVPIILESFSLNNASDSNGQYLGYYSANPVNVWPLNYDFFSTSHLSAYTEKAYQPFGQLFFVWGLILFIIITPILTYLYGKRWYCSWVCSCGGLAETIGDSFRHLSDKTKKSWKIERIVIYSVLLFVSIMSISVLFSYFSAKEFNILFWTVNKTAIYIILLLFLILTVILNYFLYTKHNKRIFLFVSGIIMVIIVFLCIAYFSGNNNVFIIRSSILKKQYGFLIGAIFSGILGVGFYPLLGSRIWCRFGCPMAAYMGIFQRFHSRFQISVNQNQCISCGNCTVYCEQGIDVRSYAQQGIDIKRSSCVGCGICATVCPRGVLKLENVKRKNND